MNIISIVVYKVNISTLQLFFYCPQTTLVFSANVYQHGNSETKLN